MKNSEEYKRWLKDMESCYKIMQILKEKGDPRSIIEQAQHVVELATKAFISCFLEPEWTHEPKEQVLTILEQHGDEIKKVCKEEMLERLKKLAEDVKEISPWHGRTVYGYKTKEKWYAAVEICTKERADWAVELAERSYKTINEFIEIWFKP